jgi:hypothetical protein
VPIRYVKSARFYDDYLHVEAMMNNDERYVVLNLASDTTAHVVWTDNGYLLGPANLAQVTSTSGARVRAGDGGVPTVEVFDLTPPVKSLKLLAAQEMNVNAPTLDPNLSGFTFANGLFYFCATMVGDTDRSLVSVPIDPEKPLEYPSVTSDAVCKSAYQNDRFVASDGVFAVWNIPTGDYVARAEVYRASGQGTVHPGDYGYNQTGVHQYGNVVAAFTDGKRAIFDPENDNWVFLFGALDQPYADYDQASLAIAGPKHVLGLVDGIAYVATPDAIRAYDVTNIHDVKLLPFEAKLPFDGAQAQLVASSKDRLAITDTGGHLFIARRDGNSVERLLIYKSGATPTCP